MMKSQVLVKLRNLMAVAAHESFGKPDGGVRKAVFSRRVRWVSATVLVVAGVLSTSVVYSGSPVQGMVDIDERGQPEAWIAEMLLEEEVAAHQREILADGYVDISELEMAGIKTEQCMAKNGLPNAKFKLSPSDGDYSFTTYYPEGWEAPEEWPTLSPEESERYAGIDNKIFTICENVNFMAVALQWAWQERLPADIQEAVNKVFEDCLEQLDEFDGSDEWLSRESDCWDEAQGVR